MTHEPAALGRDHGRAAPRRHRTTLYHLRRFSISEPCRRGPAARGCVRGVRGVVRAAARTTASVRPTAGPTAVRPRRARDPERTPRDINWCPLRVGMRSGYTLGVRLLHGAGADDAWQTARKRQRRSRTPEHASRPCDRQQRVQSAVGRPQTGTPLPAGPALETETLLQ